MSDDLHFHPNVAFEYLAKQTKPVAGVGGTLVNLISSELPDATAKLYQGIPVWMVSDKPSVGIKAAKDFVSLMFFRGQRIDDASKALIASGSFEMATVKYRSSEEIDEKQVRGWLRQAASIDGLDLPVAPDDDSAAFGEGAEAHSTVLDAMEREAERHASRVRENDE